MNIFDLNSQSPFRPAVVTLGIFCLSLSAFGQTGVSINSTGVAPDPQAILDISSTTKGALLPRMTTAQAATLGASLNAGDDGMIIYDTDAKAYKYWDGAALVWQEIPNVANTGNTLDEAYDEGGAGLGRVITSDAGAVDIQGAGGLLVNGITGIGTSTPDSDYALSVLKNTNNSVKVAGANQGLLVEMNAGSENGISSIQSSTANTSAYYAVRGEVTNESGIGYLGYHTTGDRSYGVYGAGGTFAGYFEGNTNVATGNVGIGLSADAMDKLVVAGGRVEITQINDATGTAGSGMLEIGNSLRLDDNEIITNTGTTLLINHDNNGDVGFDNGSLYVDASTDRVGIGTTGPGYKLDVSGDTRTTGDFYGDVHVDDTRDDNLGPNAYDNEVAFDFKRRSSVDNVPGSGTYSGMMTIAPWQDNSGDASHQINFNEGGLYWRQGQPDDLTWGTWYKILTTADGLPTGSGTTNYLARWTPNGTTLGIGATYDNGTSVGIGIANPGAKLTVRGGATDPSTYDDGKFLFVSGSMGSGQASDGGVEFRHDNLTQGIGFGYNTIYQTGTNANEVLNLIAKGSGNLTLNAYGGATGNVGIGTASPLAKLNIQDTDVTLMLSRAGSPTIGQTLGAIEFDAVGTSVSTVDASVVIKGLAAENQGNSNKGGHLTLNTKPIGSTLATAATERMRVTSQGNVGIGTATPAHQLSVGTATSDGQAVSVRGYSGSPGSWKGGGAFGYTAASVIMGELSGVAQIGGHNSTLTAWSDLAINAGGGNVGMGTSAPAQKLHVVGTGRFTTLGGAGDKLVYTNNNGDLLRSTAAIDPNSLIDGSGAATRVAYWSDANTLTSDGNFVFDGNNLYVNNPEASTASVRLGAAWNRPGVYSSQELQLFSDLTGIIFGDSDVERMRMTAAGSLGIGTAGPGELLHVAGNIRVGGAYAINSESDHLSLMYGVRADDASYEWTGFYSGTTRQGIILYDGAWSGANNVTNEFGITAENGNLLTLNTSGNHIALMPDGSGNVGVGTLSPGFKLHVPSGYIGTDYINTTDNSVGSGVSGVMVKAGDNYMRTGTAAAIATFLNTTGTWIPNNGSGDWQIASNSNATGYSQSSLELRETNFAGAGQQPPRLGFHWGGVVASQISIESDGKIAIRNNPGSGYESLKAQNLHLQGVVPMIQGFSPANNAIRMTPNFHFNAPAGSAIILNWDNGGVGGTTQQLRVGNGTGTDQFYVRADGQFYGRYFGDLDDGTYYIDPNSTSDAASRTRGGELHGPNVTWGAYLMVGGDGRQNYTNSTTASVAVTNGNLHMDAGSGYGMYLNFYDGDFIRFGRGNNSDRALLDGNGLYLYDGWLRPHGNNGLFFESWGGGWHMTDGTWIRSYNNKNVYVNTTLRADGGLESGGGNVLMRGSSTGVWGSASGYGFGFPSSGVLIESGYSESGGMQANGDNLNLWSPGDADLVRFYDEDGMILRSYINGGTGAYVQASDINKKQNIERITGALDKVLSLSGYTYEFKLHSEEIEKGQSPTKTAGVIAQEVDKVMPEIVDHHGEDGVYINYDGLTPYLIEAIKELKELVENQKAEIEELKRR